MQEIPAPQRIPIAVAWHPPDASWYKINFDGALFVKENCAGVGVVIRNEQGLVMASLSQSIPRYPIHSHRGGNTYSSKSSGICCRTLFGLSCIGRGFSNSHQHLMK